MDFRKPITGLAVIVEDVMQRRLFSTELYVFTNRHYNRIKILFWEDNGFCLYHKRLEQHRFHWPKLGDNTVTLTAGDVIGVLETPFLEHGRPACLRSDKGPEMVSSAVQKWLKGKHVDTHYIKPGSPWQHGYCESFNSIFRTTCLDR